MQLHIKGEKEDLFEIIINKRLYTNNEDYWDGNFLKANIKASVAGFNASFLCNLRTDELAQWETSIESFLHSNDSLISFITMEENIDLKGQADTLGFVIWKCVIKNSEEHASILSFFIKSSIVEVENLREEIKSILKQYPVLGKPY